MRENLLKKQPTWGLRRAQGTGQKSATPATLTKVILVLLTTFLLPSAAWGGNYNSGTLDTTNKTWGVWKLSDATYSSPQYDYLSFSGAGTITLTLTRPDNTSELIQRISLNIGGTETSSTTTLKSAMIGTTDITSNFVITDNSSLTYSFQPTVPIEWSGDIVITLQGKNNSSGSILGAYVQTVTGYGLSVAGVPVTDDNNTNILGDQNSTVSFTPAGQDPSATLTLKNNANITGDIVWNPSVKTDLTINLSGTNTLNGAISTNSTVETNLSFTGSTDCSLEITKGSESVISGNFKTVNFGNFNLATSSPGAYWDENENRMADYSGGAATNLKITSEVYYPIWVHDYNSSTGYLQLTPDVPSITYDGRNANHTNDKGTISFDKDHNTITLDAITYAQGTDNAVIVVGPSMSELTVDLVDESSVSDPDPVLYFTGSTNLTFTTSSSGASLSANSLYAWKNNAGSVTYNNGLVENNGTISYQAPPITVAGVSPDSEGKFSGISGVTFTPAKIGADQSSIPATLTLNEATINGKIEWNSSDNLTIALNGKNTIVSEEGGELFKSEQSCTLFIAKADNADATLKYASYSESNGKIANATGYFSGFGPITPSSDFNLTPFTVQVDGINYNYYTTAEVYPVTVAGRRVHNISGEPGYRENILGDGKVSFTPASDQDPSTPVTLTLSGATINGQIKMMDYGNLILHFVGENTITVENTNDYAIQGPGTTGTLEFSTSNGKTDILTIKGIAESKYFAGGWYSIPRLTTNSAAYDWVVISETTGNIHHISKNNKYDLWLNDTRFCDATLSYDSGIAFDPGTSTLTYAYTGPDHVIYSGLASLTIKMGNSQLKAIVFGSPDTGQPITATSGNLSIVKYSEGSSENCEFSLEGDGTNSVIRGFTSVDFGDFVVLSDGAKYNNGQLVDASGVAMTTATLSTNPVLPKPEMYSESSDETIQLGLTISNSTVSYGTLKYSIVYADNSEGVTDAVYEDDTPPTINKPATVTAWLQLNDMKSEVAKGKYFGLKNEAITIAEGDIYDSANPLDVLTPAIEEGDGIYCTYSSEEDEVVACDYENAKLEAKGTGSGSVFVFAEPTDPDNIQTYVLNNDGLELTVNVGGNLNEIFAANNNYGTFYNTSTTTYAVPEGMKAYVITGADPKTGKVTTAETTVLPPNTPVLLEKGSAKAFTYIPAISGTAPSGNILLYTGNTDVKATEGSNLYVLYNDKFVKVTTDTRILSQKCYLDLSSLKSSGTRSYYDIDGSDGTTALREVRSEGVKGEKWDDGEWYTLQGRKFTTKPTKPGLYILNGKKIVVK